MDGQAGPGRAADVRFGPFELDLRTAELRKDGRRIRLQDQPFQILLMLLERPGELVLREEIRQKLWPNGTLVEFDQGINSAVKRLRDALRESADQPRYIETLSRRGYRFIGAVEPSSAPVALVAVNVSKVVPPGAGDSRTLFRRARIPAATLLALVAVVAAMAGYVHFVRNQRSNAALEQRIVPFTSDPGVETMPSFSPDGKQVTYVRTERDPQPWRGFWKVFFGPTSVYVKVVEAGTELRLTRGPASDSFPAWSPDGQYIVFLRRTSTGDYGYYLLSALGGPERRVAAAASGSGGLAWFPTGRDWRSPRYRRVRTPHRCSRSQRRLGNAGL